MPRFSALYTMRCSEPFWFRAVQGSAVGLGFIIIPAGFNPLSQRLRGECPIRISNGVYLIGMLVFTAVANRVATWLMILIKHSD
jgi:hypothetical protein